MEDTRFQLIGINFFSFLIFIFLFDFVSANFTVPKKKDDLLRRREKIMREITTTESLLKKLETNKSEVINSLSLINRKISLRRELITNLNSELLLLDKTIDSLGHKIENHERVIVSIKKEYARVIYRTYFYFRSDNLLILLFSSPSLGVAYRRLIYLKQYHEHRRTLIMEMREEMANLFQNSIKLSQSRSEKLRLLAVRQQELATLNADLLSARRSLVKVQSRAKELQKSLESLKTSAKKIEAEIRRIIELESKKSKEGVVVNNRKSQLLATQFEQNKGNFPFPVEKGVVVSEFGEHSHPLYKGVKINNNGIDISTECNAAVFSIFSGQVSKVFFIKGSNYAIILRHGSYFTVYQNLSKVLVSNGDDVKANSILGYTSCASDESISRLHFEIWKGLEKLDPAVWLQY